MLKNKVFGGILLIASIAIGAGMLALPISTGPGGFYNAIFLFISAFLFMLYSLFLLLEINLWLPEGSNIISMADSVLGRTGRYLTWFFYLLLLYAVIAAYISGGGSIVVHLLDHSFQTSAPDWLGSLLFLLLFGVFIYFGTKPVDYLNKLLTFSLILSYLLLVVFIFPHTKLEYLSAGRPNYLWATLPIIVLSFTSHLILPSLRTYLNSNIADLKKVLFYGSCIPLTLYLLWEFLILSTVPIHGSQGLISILTSGTPVVALTSNLNQQLGVSFIGHIATIFSFFALLTSFLGASLSLKHFLMDGFDLSHSLKGRLEALIFTFLPPFFFVLFYPQGFVFTLSYAGVFVAVLFGILPTIMAWRGRYIQKREALYTAPGGKAGLLIMLLGSLIIIGLQIAHTLNLLPTPV